MVQRLDAWAGTVKLSREKNPVLRKVASVVARRSWVRKVAISTPGLRGIAWRFVAGEDLDAGLAAVRALNAHGIKGSLNYVGTHMRDQGGAAASAEMAVAALHRIREIGLDADISVKLTQVGLDIDEPLCRAHLGRIFESASELGNLVWIDMEESRYVERTLRIFEQVRDLHGPDRVGIVIQSYLRSRRADLERLIAAGSRIRIVKGGYWEPADVVLGSKDAIDRAFTADIEALMARGYGPAIATHDVDMITVARAAADALERSPATFEFQMLYGVRRDLQEGLVKGGYAVRCYVPYGGQWYEYVIGCVRQWLVGAVERPRRRLRSARGPATSG